MRRVVMRVVMLVAMLAAGLAPSQVKAHPLIDEARDAYEAARHGDAIQLLERAEDGDDLTREDLIELFLIRAMVHRAQRNMDLAEVDLLRLATLSPNDPLGRQVHPALRQLFATVGERVTRPVGLQATAVRREDSARISVSIVDDTAALTQAFRVHVRVAEGAWRVNGDAVVTVRASASDAVDYWAEAIGSGGAVIARFGSASQWHRLEPESMTPPSEVDVAPDVVATTVATTVATSVATPEVVTADSDEEVPAWPFVVGGVAALVVAGVVLGVFFGTQPTDATRIGRLDVSLTPASMPLLRFE